MHQVLRQSTLSVFFYSPINYKRTKKKLIKVPLIPFIEAVRTKFSSALHLAVQVGHDGGELGPQRVVNPPLHLAAFHGCQARNPEVEVVGGGGGGVGEQVEEDVVVL